jgi:hypothetical protein
MTHPATQVARIGRFDFDDRGKFAPHMPDL